ncbi:Zinc finger, CCHC-type [Senna tora]|uniref:Zinc finger, CCHC-type n=1 Tax=Senna tora TaxID=362788 RepID=A0A834SV79_9FABA|nr:Zinc finger, CCHC-type [Senna tora]
MANTGDESNGDRYPKNSDITLIALRQQIERMNVVVGDIRDRLDRQDDRIANLQENRPNHRRHHRRRELMCKKTERPQWLVFLMGLNKDIADIVDLHHYVELEDMVHMAIKVENSSSAKETTKGKEEASSKSKGIYDSQTSRNRDIKCFKCLGSGHISSQCPNKRVMIFKDREVMTDDDNDDSMPSLEEIVIWELNMLRKENALWNLLMHSLKKSHLVYHPLEELSIKSISFEE